MGRLLLNEHGGLRPHSYTKSEYDNEITLDLLHHRLSKIEKLISDRKNSACYIVGMGALPKSVYEMLSKEDGIEVVWMGSIMPWYLQFLSFAIASYAGLIKIIDPIKILKVFPILIEQSMAGIYIFDTKYENKFITTVKNNPSPSEYDYATKDDSSYFIYMVDGDNSESSTGIFEIVSYGVSATKAAEIF